ncbi:hypothetical protein [Luteolibacter soli]|uniref:Uncharacterized protein n=1 Tax=Luteolibacter soli TaxID=3135280 RepID=A0ABU9B021_9BACT
MSEQNENLGQPLDPIGADFDAPIARTGGRTYKLADIALAQNFGVLAGVTTRAATPPLKKFGKQVFFSPHPDPKYYTQQFATIGNDDERGQLYIVPPWLQEKMPGETSVKHFVPCISRDGSITLMPIGEPVTFGSPNPASQSLWKAVLSNQNSWVRLTWDPKSSGFRQTSPIQEWPAPVWPDNLDELFEEAITEQLITDENHWLIQKLLGAGA